MMLSTSQVKWFVHKELPLAVAVNKNVVLQSQKLIEIHLITALFKEDCYCTQYLQQFCNKLSYQEDMLAA